MLKLKVPTRITAQEAYSVLEEVNRTLNVKGGMVGGIAERGYSYNDVDIKVITDDVRGAATKLLSNMPTYPFPVGIYLNDDGGIVFYNPGRPWCFSGDLWHYRITKRVNEFRKLFFRKLGL